MAGAKGGGGRKKGPRRRARGTAGPAPDWAEAIYRATILRALDEPGLGARWLFRELISAPLLADSLARWRAKAEGRRRAPASIEELAGLEKYDRLVEILREEDARYETRGGGRGPPDGPGDPVPP